MLDPIAEAIACGIALEVGDLGEWGGVTLIAEYDPCGPTIRINRRSIERYCSSCVPAAGDLGAFIDFAVAHELYHHAERTGARATLSTRCLRERAADAFARANVPVRPALDSFLRTGQ